LPFCDFNVADYEKVNNDELEGFPGPYNHAGQTTCLTEIKGKPLF